MNMLLINSKEAKTDLSDTYLRYSPITVGKYLCSKSSVMEYYPNILGEIFEILSEHISRIFRNFHLVLSPIFRGPD